MPRSPSGALALLFLLGSTPLFAAESHSATALAVQTILADQLQRHVDVLADDTFEGRDAGTRGGHAAGAYLHKYFAKHDLKPAGDGGDYFQGFGSGMRNILGVMGGSDPELKDDYILVGAHYDHVGYGTRRTSYGPTGYIHNGADDNASGVAAVLELIEAFRGLPSPPRRPILFALWDGEEHGLLGSKHWAAAPTLPLEQIAFAFNIDMIGRLRGELKVYGSRSGVGLRQIVVRQNEAVGLPLMFDWEMKANSDHHSFFARNIPVLMFHTGLHDDYHRPSDDAHKLNSDGMEQVSRLLFQTALTLANDDRRIEFRSQAGSETNNERKAFEAPHPLPTPRLGVAWSQDSQPGLLIDQVVSGSPAHYAGLAAGDRILKFNGDDVVDESRLNLEVLAAKDAAIKFVRQRGEDRQEVEIALVGNPMRIGIAWRPDAADPSVVVVSLVVPGSAADQAGIVVGDRIFAVEGEPFRGSDDLLNKLVTKPGLIPLTIERRGQLKSVTLAPLPPVKQN